MDERLAGYLSTSTTALTELECGHYMVCIPVIPEIAINAAHLFSPYATFLDLSYERTNMTVRAPFGNMISCASRDQILCTFFP